VETQTGSEEGSAGLQGELWGVRARDWAEVQEGTVLPLYQEVLTKTGIGQGTNLLDVGCGAGSFCALAAARGSSVSGFDATQALIDIAKSRTPEGRFELGDMESLPYPEATFDVVTGFNSFLYAANPANALREARRVAAQGAWVVIAVWGRPEDCKAAACLAAVGKLLPPPPPGATGPFALSDVAALRQLVQEAGMSQIEINDVDCPWVYKDAETTLRGLLSAGPAVKAMRTSGEDRAREAMVAALEPFRNESGGYRLENKFRYALARA
jgi:SAM-dependent methyltransferase